MDERTMELLFGMLTNEQLMELREKGAMDGPSMLAFKTELFKRCLIEMPEVLEAVEYCDQWKAANEPKKESYVVTYLYAPLKQVAFGGDSGIGWGIGTTMLEAKSTADAFAHFNDHVGKLELRDADGNVTWTGPWTIATLSIYCVGDGKDLSKAGQEPEEEDSEDE